MDKFKEELLLKTEKFEAIMFTLDYIQNIRDITGEFDSNDIMVALIRLYDISFENGKSDVLDRTINSMFGELDEIEARQDKGD
jgi:hypothetical protein